MSELTLEVKALAKAQGAHLLGIASVDRFAEAPRGIIPLQNRTRMTRILQIPADSLIYPRVSAQSASSAFYDLAFSDAL